MGQGVYFIGEVNPNRSLSESEKTVTGNSVGLDMKVSEITGIRPETS